jgi:hypothetical protein
MRILLVLCLLVISSAAIGQSIRHGRDKSKPSYHSCMVRLHSYGLSPRAARDHCRLFSPGGVSR